MLLIIAFGILIGFCANVYANVLSHEEVLNWWFRFGARYEGRWFWKPIWGCQNCIAGQWALWFYIFRVISDRFFPQGEFFCILTRYPKIEPSLLEGLILVLISIGSAKAFNYLNNRIDDN